MPGSLVRDRDVDCPTGPCLQSGTVFDCKKSGCHCRHGRLLPPPLVLRYKYLPHSYNAVILCVQTVGIPGHCGMVRFNSRQQTKTSYFSKSHEHNERRNFFLLPADATLSSSISSQRQGHRFRGASSASSAYLLHDPAPCPRHEARFPSTLHTPLSSPGTGALDQEQAKGSNPALQLRPEAARLERLLPHMRRE